LTGFCVRNPQGVKPTLAKTVTNNKEFAMIQKMCFYNVLKCPKTPAGCCELLGSFENEDEAKRFRGEESKEIDNDHFIILIDKLEYDPGQS